MPTTPRTSRRANGQLSSSAPRRHRMAAVDAAWLHAEQDRALNGCASDPKRLALIQEAYALAERTPWRLGVAEPRDSHAADPRLAALHG